MTQPFNNTFGPKIKTLKENPGKMILVRTFKEPKDGLSPQRRAYGFARAIRNGRMGFSPRGDFDAYHDGPKVYAAYVGSSQENAE